LRRLLPISSPPLLVAFELLVALQLLALCVAPAAQAQWYGSLSLGAQATNNVQSLDTIAPDRILMPAFELNYDAHPSPVSTITLTAGYAPNFYAINPGLSFNATTVGATGLFYLTHQDAIAAAANTDDPEALHVPKSAKFQEWEPGLLPVPKVHTEKKMELVTRSDSLVDLAVSALYTLSGELDSTDISPNGISKARASELEDTRDSISDVISTIADLLDSAGYSESTAEIVLEELQHLKPPLAIIVAHAIPSQAPRSPSEPSHPAASQLNPELLDDAIELLGKAKPEADFLPSAASAITPSVSNPQAQKLLAELAAPAAAEEAEVPHPAPALTLVTSSTRIREFGYADADIRDDAEDSDATTLATTLTVPVSYATHSGVHYSPSDSLLYGGNFGGNPNDNRQLSFGAALEGLTSDRFSLRGSYDFIEQAFPFDSVYTNTENRLTLTPRIALGTSTVLFGEAAIGFRKYLDPLVVTLSPAKYDTVHRPKKGDTVILLKAAVTQTAGSAFHQFSFGAGLAQFFGQEMVVGGLVAFNDNPNLRAYVTTAQITTGPRGKALRAAAQIADDEYTYNLGRFTLFTDVRVWGGVDVGIDLSYEHRTYGSAVGPKGGILDSGRTEKGTFLDLSISKLFPFETRWLGVFNGLLLEAKLESADVTSTQPIYSYSASNFLFTTTLNF